jgi:Xaa-Pro aminopeptidase
MDRIEKVRNKLKKEKLDGVLISSVTNITYLTGYSNFSKEERDAFVLITPKEQFIITHDLYINEVKDIKGFKLLEVNPKKRTHEYLKELKIKKLGVEIFDLSIGEAKRLLKGVKYQDFAIDRSVKNKEEIKRLREACRISDLAFEYVLTEIKVGVTEKELARKMEDFIRSSGGEVAFRTIVAFGKNSATPHHLTDSTKLKSGDIIQFDFGAKFEGYCSDVSRALIFGKASEKQRALYNHVLAAQALAAIVKGKKIKAADLDKASRDYLKKQGLEIPHSVGHGLGLDVHEAPHISPRSKEPLVEGMVLTLEPGVYIPGFGGFRIEDDYLYSGGKLIQLTHAPKNLIEL